MRAAMKPGWEDLVRRCIQKFHAQHEGEAVSYAKRHHHEGTRRPGGGAECPLPGGAVPEAATPEGSPRGGTRLVPSCARVSSHPLARDTSPPEGRFHRRPGGTDSAMREIDLELRISQAHERKGKEVFFLDPKASRGRRHLVSHHLVPKEIIA